MERMYAQAIQNLLAKGASEEKVYTQLIAQLTASGRMKLLPKIKRELERLTARKPRTIIEVAHQSDVEAAHTAAKTEGIEAGETIVNPSLVHGWRVRSNGLLIDQSGKRALIDLYRRIIT